MCIIKCSLHFNIRSNRGWCREIGDPNCKLIKPYVYNSIDDMVPWKADITNQTEFMIRSEDILTIADPNGTIIDKYTELTA